MKKILFSLVAFFALLGNALATDFEKLQNQTVLILAEDGQGSGVLITKTLEKDRYNFILTCAHVVDAHRYEEEVVDVKTKVVSKVVKWKPVKISKEIIKGDENIIEITTEADIISYSEPEDLAILLVRNRNFTDVGAKFAKKPPKIGDTVNHAGNYNGAKGCNSVSSGMVAKLKRIIDDKRFTQINTTIYKGSSGGGLYNTDDECFGVLARTSGENWNFMIPLDRISEWTEKTGFAFLLDGNPLIKSKEQFEKLPVELNVKTTPTLAPIIVNPFDFKIDFLRK